jgi:hypothetical protein
VYRGTEEEIKSALVLDFDLDDASVTLPLAGLVNNAQRQAEALSAVKGTVLSSVPTSTIPATSAGPKTDEAQQPSSEGDVWAAAESAAQEPQGPHPLLAQIDACADVEALKRLWAENQAALAEPDLFAAWKARGRALSSA